MKVIISEKRVWPYMILNFCTDLFLHVLISPIYGIVNMYYKYRHNKPIPKMKLLERKKNVKKSNKSTEHYRDDKVIDKSQYKIIELEGRPYLYDYVIKVVADKNLNSVAHVIHDEGNLILVKYKKGFFKEFDEIWFPKNDTSWIINRIYDYDEENKSDFKNDIIV